jgi:Helicase C-terminal domain
MSDNIASGVEILKGGKLLGITVLVNRYDGVDLPDDACRLLVIDGLPEVQGLTERVESNLLEGTDTYLLRQIQKLEQGMGRGVRSEEDRCAVLLSGARLTQRINQPNARAMFTPATQVQMELGREVTRQIKGKPISDLRGILDLCIERNTEQGVKWWQAGRSRLAQAPEGQASRVDSVAISQRVAFDHLMSNQVHLAEGVLQTSVHAEQDHMVRGYLKQQLAEIKQISDPAEAQKILLSAVSDNRRVLKPLAGITHLKLNAPASQASAAAAMMSKRFIDTNQLVLFTNALADDLVWDKERTNRFEAAIRDLGLLVGFGSQRPDEDYKDGGPDNLWAVGNLLFLVIECKSGVDDDGRLISKDHCNQLLGANSWFKKNYDNTCRSVPILIHPNHKFQNEASPSPDMRIIDNEKLTKLRQSVRSLGAAVAKLGNFKDGPGIGKQLDQYNFTAAKFVAAFSRPFSS